LLSLLQERVGFVTVDYMRGKRGLNHPANCAREYPLESSSMNHSSAYRNARYSGLRVKSAGFTIIELVVVMSILVILFGLALPSYRDFQAGQALAQATQTLKADLRFAQSQALAGVKPNSSCGPTDVLRGWFIQFQESSYSIYVRCGNPGNLPAPQKTVTLPNSVKLQVPLPNNMLFVPVTSEVVFTSDALRVPCNPSCVSNASSQDVTLVKGSKAVIVRVLSTGDISEQQTTTSIPGGGPTATPAPGGGGKLTPTPTSGSRFPTATPTPTSGGGGGGGGGNGKLTPTPTSGSKFPTATPTPIVIPTATPTSVPTPTTGGKRF